MLIAPKIVRSFTVDVDYTKPISEMVEAGNYDVASGKINEQRFTIAHRPSGSVEIAIFGYEDSELPEHALTDITSQGYRPVELAEILALGAQHPDAQLDFDRILALGATTEAVWSGRPRKQVVCISRAPNPVMGRRLTLGDWDKGYLYKHFAAVREG